MSESHGITHNNLEPESSEEDEGSANAADLLADCLHTYVANGGVVYDRLPTGTSSVVWDPNWQLPPSAEPETKEETKPTNPYWGAPGI